MRKSLFRKTVIITLSAFLVFLPVQTSLAEEASAVSSGGKIRYLESSGASFALITSNNETLAISFSADVAGLSSLLEKEGADHIDSLIMTVSSDDIDTAQAEASLKELHEAYPVGHFYAAGGNALTTPAGRMGIRTDYAEYLSVGDENVILYPDDAGNLGVLVFDANGSLFAADSITDMSVLQDHPETAYISVLSISDKTGTDEEVISSMNPQACIITGNLPDNRQLSAFYHTNIADTQTFYINHSTMDGILMDFSDLSEIRDAAALYVAVPDPEAFPAELVPEAVDEESVSGKQAIAEAALRIWRGEIGGGQTRTDTLRSEGFTDEEIQQIQSLVDKIAREHLGACTAVLFYAGDYAEDPDAQIVSIRSTATEPQLTSTDEHYQFTGWYTDPECTEKFDFSTPIENKTKLYAGWAPVE